VSVTTPDAPNFRKVLGRLPTGVVVVTGGHASDPAGLVVGSFMSLSLKPPLVALAPGKSSTSWPRIAESGKFCANVLSHDQEELCKRFATSGAGSDKFEGLSWNPSPATGSPLFDGAAAWMTAKSGRSPTGRPLARRRRGSRTQRVQRFQRSRVPQGAVPPAQLSTGHLAGARCSPPVDGSPVSNSVFRPERTIGQPP